MGLHLPRKGYYRKYWLHIDGILSDRRGFFKKAAKMLLGSAIGFAAFPQIPQLMQATSPPTFALGQKQLQVLLASKKLMERFGMLRAQSIFHYSNDGQIMMDWSVVIPSEENISNDAANIAQQVLNIVGQSV
jgi:hypothetical protein